MQSFQIAKFRFLVLSAIVLLFPTKGTLAQEKFSWKQLGENAPPVLQQQVRHDYAADTNSNQPVKVDEMKLLQVHLPQAKPLYLINTRISGTDPDSSPTCGQAGCLFYGYTSDKGKFVQVLNGYINDLHLKNAPPIIQPTNQIVNQLPCLQLNSYSSQSQQLIRTKLCFDGKEYQPISKPTVVKQ